MGLFSRLKADLNHGGIKLHIQAPSSVPSNQVIPVTVAMSADATQTINSVTAELKAQVREQGLSIGGGADLNQTTSNYQTVAKVENREPFTINPGETKTVALELYLNGTPAGANPLSQLGAMGGAVGGALQAVASAAQGFEHVSYIYKVHASADVQGVGIGPSDNQAIQILPPTTAGPQPINAVQSVAAQAASPPLPVSPAQPTTTETPPQSQQYR